eukprot:351675-Chlamydomonas_euryale.AAC.7
MSHEAAIQDFKERIRKYQEVYQPIDDRTYHYIKLIDMVTGRCVTSAVQRSGQCGSHICQPIHIAR